MCVSVLWYEGGRYFHKLDSLDMFHWFGCFSMCYIRHFVLYSIASLINWIRVSFNIRANFPPRTWKLPLSGSRKGSKRAVIFLLCNSRRLQWTGDCFTTSFYWFSVPFLHVLPEKSFMFEQIESYQPITITIEASYLRLMSNDCSLFPSLPMTSLRNMTFSLCSKRYNHGDI